MSPKHIKLPSPLFKALVTPDGSCFMAFSDSPRSSRDINDQVDVKDPGLGSSSRRSLWAHVYVVNHSLSFLKCLQLDSISIENFKHLQSAECKFFDPHDQMQLVFISNDSNGRAYAESHVLEVSTAQQGFPLSSVVPSSMHVGGTESISSRVEDSCGSPALDYICHVFDKYPVSPPLCSPKRVVHISVLFDPSGQDERWNGQTASKWCEDTFMSTRKKLKEKGKHLDEALFKFSTVYLSNDLDDTEDGVEDKNRKAWQMGKWIQRAVSLVPIQISRAENNSLKPMLDGLEIPADVVYTNAVSLSHLLRFGLYDLLIANWKGQIKVVSSMGKQSSGKSYLLNHLAGCFLDVGGGRCSDGVWMTVRSEEDCLYVLLDFEGLGSFQRTDQEDMLLSILSAAVSNLTIFNMKDFDPDKEIEAIFQRFQDGISLVKADDKLFKGLLYIAIKDVDVSVDVEDLKAEFHKKMQNICGKPKEHFLMTKYLGEVEIAAMPPFQQHEFQESVADIGEVIREMDSCYRSGGTQFLEDMKLVISHISARDWAPIDSKRLISRLSVLRQHLNHAISMGQCVDGSDLLDFKEQREIEDGSIVVDKRKFDIKDAGLQLANIIDDDDSKPVGAIVENLGQMFALVVERQQMDKEECNAAYEAFVGCLVERRSKRVMEWLEVNTRQFEQEGDVEKLKLEAKSKLAELKSKLVICSCKCESCFMRCILVKGHHMTEQHSCRGTHRCVRDCTYCKEKDPLMVLSCGDLAGHSGSHDCKHKEHTCAKFCVFSLNSSNCNKICSQRVDHDGVHRCNSKKHRCNQTCSLPGCPNTCAIPVELGNHADHACHDKFCPSPCSMMGCKRSCAVKDHFHDLNPQAEHFCDQSHPCTMKCQVPGICYVQTELVKQMRSFRGKRSKFDYEFVSEQTETRKECCIPIPPSRRDHDGHHKHSTNPNVAHYCSIRCPACDYFCNLPLNHAGLHKAVHGNMKNMRFVSEEENIDLSDRKYVRGESGEAEMCMMHCKSRGRGHTHLVPCPADAVKGVPCTENIHEGARHVKNMTGLGVNVAMDELTHEAYWKYIRFVDPCEDEEKEVFAMCPHYCMSDVHNQGRSSSRSYCKEKLCHDPVQREGSQQTESGGYVTVDGHRFSCNHAVDEAHNVIFVMDRSGSMDAEDIKPTMSKFTSRDHNNRLGCVFEGVLRFVQIRMRGLNVGSVMAKDTVSVVLFDHEAVAAVEGVEISEAVVDELLYYAPDGGTDYSAGLEEAERMLARLSNRGAEVSRKWPVIIFLSDGGNLTPMKTMDVLRRMKKQDARLVVHTIMFGHDANLDELQAMAKEGEGTFQHSMDEEQLAKSFEGLAKSLKPTLASLVAIP